MGALPFRRGPEASRTGPNQRSRLTAWALLSLVRETWSEWSEDKAPRLGAALAYYTIFSVAPLLVIAVAFAGLVFDPAEAERAVLGQIGGLVGQAGADLVGTMLAGARRPGTSLISSTLGVIGVLLGAMGAFGQLQDALNTIWEVKPKPGRGIRGIIQDRLLSLGMVLTVGFLLLVSLVVSTALSALGNFVGGGITEWSWLLNGVNIVTSLSVITVLFALMFKYVPDVKMAWRDLWLGAFITALLFTVGKAAIGLYLGNAAVTSTYGAAGSLVVLLLWVYYSAQIFFLGAEFTQVYANRFGSRVVPEENAMPIGEGERAEEGMTRETGDRAPTRPAAVPMPAGETLPVVGPHEALPAVQPALVAGQPHALSVRARTRATALVTFAAGLGLGALVALQASEAAPREANRRRHMKANRK